MKNVTTPATGTELDTRDIVAQVEKVAELARIGQNFIEASAHLSDATIQAMINDVVTSGNTRLISLWPAHIFAHVGK